MFTCSSNSSLLNRSADDSVRSVLLSGCQSRFNRAGQGGQFRGFRVLVFRGLGFRGFSIM